MISKQKFSILVLVLLSTFLFGFFDLSTPQSQTSKQINLENIKRISRSTYLIQHEYYDPDRIKPKKMLKEGFYELAKEVPEILPKFENNNLNFQLGSKSINLPLGQIKKLYDIFPIVSQAFDFLKQNYKGKTKFEDMEYAFIGGMLSVLDPHSNILPPKIYEEFKTQTLGEYGGLGIVIGIKDKELTVIAPIEDTPAYNVGLLADDKILQIDKQSTMNMSLTDAVDLMRGPPKTKVTLKIKSKNRDPRDVTITREIIVIHSVVSKLIQNDNKKFGVIRIKGFQEDTYQDLIKELKNLQNNAGDGLSGIILDLRNNPGGLLDQSILVADKFLDHGDIVYTVGANNVNEETAVAKKQNGDINLPLVVLINEGSASASEIVAGALKNNKRAIVMGQKSFGKGSVQSLFNLRDGSSLKLTVAQYLTPGKESIQAVGINPDIHLYASKINKEFYDLIEDLDFSEEKLDAHLDNKELIKNSKPLYSLTYLDNSDPDKDQNESTYVSKIKENDFALQLAIKILDKATDSTKEGLIKNLPSIIDKESINQEQLITEALKKRGVDWSLGQKTKEPTIEIKHRFLTEDGKPTETLKAGTTATLEITIKNTGTEPVYHLLTDIDAMNPLLNHKEFVFGKLNPNQEKSEKTSIKIPPEIINFSEKIKLLTYTELTNNNPLKELVDTKFIEKEQPQLAFSYNIKDGNTPDSKGNNDGIPEKGEEIAMQVSVKNLGPGVSNNTSINIKNTEGKYVFLKKAREDIGKLEPNQTITKTLYFNINKDFDKDEFNIDLFAIDDDTKASINDTLSFKFDHPAKVTPKPNQIQIAPNITISQNTKQIGDKIQLVGTATHPNQLKDLSVFVKGKKLVYINLENKEQTKTKNFNFELPLENGINSIVIQARGKRDLQTQKTLSVVYDKEDSLTTAQQQSVY